MGSAVLVFLGSELGTKLVIAAVGGVLAWLTARSKRAAEVLDCAERAFEVVEAWAASSGAKGNAKAEKFFGVVGGMLAARSLTLTSSEKRALYTRFLSERAAAPKVDPEKLPEVR